VMVYQTRQRIAIWHWSSARMIKAPLSNGMSCFSSKKWTEQSAMRTQTIMLIVIRSKPERWGGKPEIYIVCCFCRIGNHQNSHATWWHQIEITDDRISFQTPVTKSMNYQPSRPEKVTLTAAFPCVSRRIWDRSWYLSDWPDEQS
jgi:hypothetical protein